MKNCDSEATEFLSSLIKPTLVENKIENDLIVIRGIPISVSEQEIETALLATKAAFESLKVAKTKQGISRGFAFVKFYTKELARNWIQRNSEITVAGTNCKCEYSFQQKDDWECIHCGGMNFSKRDECYRCGIPKIFNTELDHIVNVGSRDIGTVPFRFLLLRGFPVECEPQTVFEQLSCTRFYLVKNRDSKKSLCFGFAEYPTEKEAIEVLRDKVLEITGKPITITFAHPGSFLTAQSDTLYISLSSIENGHLVYKRYWDESCFCEAYPPLDFDILTEPKKLKKVTRSKKLSSQFQKWQESQKHYDIAGVSIPILFERVPSTEQISLEFSEFEKFHCLLCRRKFQSTDDLQKHLELSLLHKQNIRFYKKKRLDKLVETETRIAKEKAIYEERDQTVFQPTKYGIRSDNVGNRLLKKMGWKQGQGLGVDGQGITKVIKLEKRRKGAGLGTLHPIKKFKH